MCCNRAPKVLIQDLHTMPKQSLKICLVGDIAVGKTTLAKRFIGEPQTSKTTPTIVMDVHRVEMLLDNGTSMPICIWDTAGQERFDSVAITTMRRTDAVILVYALNAPATLHKLMYHWYPLVRNASPEFKEVLLVGNKSDLEVEGDTNNTDTLLASFCELLKEQSVRFVLVRISASQADQETCTEIFRAFVRRTTFANPEVLSFVQSQ